MATLSASAAVAFESFARDLSIGLTHPVQKAIPPKYFYDEVGSALFEAITYLPEYGLTRAEERILQRHAVELPRLVTPAAVVELGSGSGRKTRLILEQFVLQRPLTYYPIDVSATALNLCRQELGGIDGLDFEGLEMTFLDGLRHVIARRRKGDRLLVLFLGSSIGNFETSAADEFLGSISRMLAPGDAFLLGADLIKEESILLAAYDDPCGVTAAFNRNVLARINRELGGNFDLREFSHETRYDRAHQRVEMHLRCSQPQEVRIADCNLHVSIEAGETIWTESSHKYSARDLAEMAARCGFRTLTEWTDLEWPFELSLWTL
jgi:dimethylhistidine N-methyltransferase